jgi:hypothetical protein
MVPLHDDCSEPLRGLNPAKLIQNRVSANKLPGESLTKFSGIKRAGTEAKPDVCLKAFTIAPTLNIYPPRS